MFKSCAWCAVHVASCSDMFRRISNVRAWRTPLKTSHMKGFWYVWLTLISDSCSSNGFDLWHLSLVPTTIFKKIIKNEAKTFVTCQPCIFRACVCCYCATWQVDDSEFGLWGFPWGVWPCRWRCSCSARDVETTFHPLNLNISVTNSNCLEDGIDKLIFFNQPSRLDIWCMFVEPLWHGMMMILSVSFKTFYVNLCA